MAFQLNPCGKTCEESEGAEDDDYPQIVTACVPQHYQKTDHDESGQADGDDDS